MVVSFVAVGLPESVERRCWGGVDLAIVLGLGLVSLWAGLVGLGCFFGFFLGLGSFRYLGLALLVFWPWLTDVWAFLRVFFFPLPSLST